MLEIVEGSLDESKEEMKLLLKQIRSRLSQFRKHTHHSKRTDQQQSYLDKWDAFLDRFKVSQMAPVKVGHIIINYKVYGQLIKKLKGFSVQCELQDRYLVIYYEKPSVKGEMRLFDISHLTKEIVEIKDFFPRAEIIDY